MAIGKASDFKIYNDQFFGGVVEKLARDTSALRSVGINLTTRQVKGDYEFESFINNIPGVITRRDTMSVAAVTDIAVTMGENASVKLNRKIGPIAQTLDAWKKAAISVSDTDWDPDGGRFFSRMLGAKFAKDIEAAMLDDALLSCRVFLENANTNSNRHTIAANGTLETKSLVSALSLMGDASTNIRAWIMHSKAYFDLLQYQINPANNGTDLAFATIQAASPASLNRPIFVTDSPSLVVTGTPDLYRTIGIVEGGVSLVNSEEQTLMTDIVTGLENIVVRMQGEFAYNLSLKGARWDVTNGGVNPNGTALGTASNWDQTVASMKDSAGVVIISG